MKPYLFGVGLAGLFLFAVAVSPQSNPSPQTLVEAQSLPVTTPETAQPHRLVITVKVQDPSDLKVKQGDRLKVGQVIANRDREQQRLNAQKQQFTLYLRKLESFQPLAPTPPQAIPAIIALPPNSYLEQVAEGERAKAAIASVESELETKKQEIAYLKELPNLDPIILDHEQAKLKELKLTHTAHIRGYQLALGKLQTAKNQRAYQEYLASLESAKRVEELNQLRSTYERQLAEYQQRLTDREFQIAQLKGKLQEVDNAIASLSTIKSPYNGAIRRVKWLNQSPDGSLTAELTLIVGK